MNIIQISNAAIISLLIILTASSNLVGSEQPGNAAKKFVKRTVLHCGKVVTVIEEWTTPSVIDNIGSYALEATKNVAQQVKRHPYAACAIAAGIAMTAFLGYLLGRRSVARETTELRAQLAILLTALNIDSCSTVR